MSQLTIKQARVLVADLFRPRPATYWTDFLLSLTVAYSASLILVGFDSWYNAAVMYGLSVTILTMNHFRTLAAHRYTSQGGTMSLEDQLLDSVDLPNRDWLTLALCPVGLRFHALHHLFPRMPYHNLELAHYRLMRELPAQHAYRKCVATSMQQVIAELLAHIHSNSQPAAMPLASNGFNVAAENGESYRGPRVA